MYIGGLPSIVFNKVFSHRRQGWKGKGGRGRFKKPEKDAESDKADIFEVSMLEMP